MVSANSTQNVTFNDNSVSKACSAEHTCPVMTCNKRASWSDTTTEDWGKDSTSSAVLGLGFLRVFLNFFLKNSNQATMMATQIFQGFF